MLSRALVGDIVCCCRGRGKRRNRNKKQDTSEPSSAVRKIYSGVHEPESERAPSAEKEK